MARWRWLADGPTGGLFVRGNGAKAGDFTFVLGAGAGTTTGGEAREADGGVVGGGELQGEEKKCKKKWVPTSVAEEKEKNWEKRWATGWECQLWKEEKGRKKSKNGEGMGEKNWGPAHLGNWKQKN